MPLVADLFSRHDTSSLTPAQLAENDVDPYEETPKYARGVVYFVCGFMALFVGARFVLSLRRRFAPIFTKSGFYRRVIAASRYLATKQQKVLGVHFPTLGVSLVIFAFFAFTMIWTWGTLPYYRSAWNVGGSPLAMRSGLMALGCFPFIMAFSAKWNFVTFITGHSHEKLQVYHQFMSHIFLILSLIHSFPWLVQGMAEVKPGFEPMTQIEWSWHVAHKVYYWSGAALLIILAWLCWASLPFFRNRFYESFKYLHVISALLFTAFFFIHCNRLLGSWDYLYATVVIYGASVVCRFGWMLYTNSSGMPRASFELMPAGMVKLRVACNPLEVWQPGQHYFFHFLTVAPFESHPFTIASIPKLETDEPQELVVLIRSANGLTKRLSKYLAKHDGAKTIPVLLDGPFGGVGQDLSIYEHVLLVVGGTGVTFITPILQDLVRKSNLGETVCKSVHVVWSVRDEESLSWMINEIQGTARKAIRTSITIQIHVTGNDRNQTTSDSDSDSKIKESSSSPTYGRADISSVVRAAGAETRTLGVAVCGPGSLLYDVRNAVAGLQRDIALGKPGCNEVYLHSEEYAW
ncbi:hypothetical protein V5O48_000257 [Marasmius crinis-equi]|uniref:ferric-chelate reductase (NADPH) n=1 Tax=Marasmius crinis-equi TaxID=585013 RepID=A0ABR3G203_9AGAR